MEKTDSLKEYSAGWWINEMDTTSKELDTKWRETADSIVQEYLDDRKNAQADALSGGNNKYNIFWANIRILKSALYATPPKPTVTRIWQDAADDAARVASLILERILQRGISKDRSDMHAGFKQCVEDRLIPGLGQVWFRYEVETEQYKTEEVKDSYGNVLVQSMDAERIVKECVHTDYVYWRDFLWQQCRTWEECGWVARRVWMKKKQFIKRFGEKAEEIWKQIKQNSSSASTAKDQDLPKGFKKGKVEVFEIWCEETNHVYWVNRHMDDEFLDEKDDPLELDNFFPCPPPLLATHTTNSLVPRPDYAMCQDQYRELNVLNNRIYLLTKALRVVGIYDKDNTELKQLLSGGEFNMVAVENWAALAEKGGMKGQVDWFPVEQIAKVLMELTQQRIAVIQQIYELTSISDIMRGASNPRETLGAQKLKSQYSSVSLQLTQQDVASFVRDAMLIKAQIVANFFQPETILDESAIEETESGRDPALIAAAIDLLKNWQEGQYRIEISEESLSIADYTAEREMRIELLTGIGQFLSQAAGLIKEKPEMTAPMMSMIKWAVASFRGSADIETVLDAAIGKLNAESQQGAPQEDKRPEAQAKIATAQITAQQKAKDTEVQVQAGLAETEMKLASAERIASEANQTKIIVEEMKQEGAQAAQATALVEGEQSRAHEAQMSAQDQQFSESQAAEDRAFNEAQSAEDRKQAVGLARTKAAQKKE